MKNNVGTIDAMMRITCGLFGLAWSTSKMTSHPFKSRYSMIGAISAMKVAEGITRYCPVFDMLNINTAECNSNFIKENSNQQSKEFSK